MAKNRVIGKDNTIPWHITEDYVRTRKITENHPIIMGRNNFISISGHKNFEGSDGKDVNKYKPLPNRTNIVLSHIANQDAKYCVSTDNLHFVSSIDEALEIAKKSKGSEEIFIFGGASIYEQFLEVANKMYITLIDEEIDGNIFFPEWNKDEWKRTKRLRRIVRVGEKEIRYEFREYKRINNT